MDSRADQAPDSIMRNAIFAGASKVSGAAFTAVLMIFLVRYLGPEDYGVFALALGVGGLMTVPADLGISVSAARFIAERRGDPDAMARVVADAIRLKIFVTGAASLALFAVAGPIANAYDTPDLGVAVADPGHRHLRPERDDPVGDDLRGARAHLRLPARGGGRERVGGDRLDRDRAARDGRNRRHGRQGGRLHVRRGVRARPGGAGRSGGASVRGAAATGTLAGSSDTGRRS